MKSPRFEFNGKDIGLTYNPFTGKWEGNLWPSPSWFSLGGTDITNQDQYKVTGTVIASGCIPSGFVVDEEEQLQQRLQNLKFTKEIIDQNKEKKARIEKLKKEIADLEKELGLAKEVTDKADPCKG